MVSKLTQLKYRLFSGILILLCILVFFGYILAFIQLV